MKVVTAIGSWSAFLALGKTSGDRVRHERTYRALRLAIRGFPIKAILLPGIAEDFVRILAVLRRVFLLRRCQFLANANGRHLIPANSPVQDLFLSGLGVEVPRLTLIHQRNWCRPIMRADI